MSCRFPYISDESHCIMQRIWFGGVEDGKGRRGAMLRLSEFIYPFYVRFMCRRSSSNRGFIDRRPIATAIRVVDIVFMQDTDSMTLS